MEGPGSGAVWLATINLNITYSMDMNLGELQEMVRDRGGLVCCSPWGGRVGHDLATEKETLAPCN